MHPTVEPEAPEVEFVELSEDPQETEEILELVPFVQGVSEDTNLARTQGKPRCIYTYVFTIIMQSSKTGLFSDCALDLGVDCNPVLLCIIHLCSIGHLCHLCLAMLCCYFVVTLLLNYPRLIWFSL